MNRTRLTILGAGPGGYVPAIRAAREGMDVTVIEEKGLGGVCLQHGCIPVKSLLISARAYTGALKANKLGVDCSDVSFDYARMVERKDSIIATNEQGIEALFKRNGVTLVRGRGTLVSPGTVAIEGENPGSITSDAVMIATGSSSIVPGFISLDQKRIFDCEGALRLTKPPETCVILGGGILGCEFASLFADFGTHVTIIEKLPTLLPTWDPDMIKALMRMFRRRKITVKTGVAVKEVCGGNNGPVEIILDNDERIEAATCLAAFGRKPNDNGIGLETLGIERRSDGRPGIAVDSAMQTNVDGVYAVGDVTGIRPLAHVASAQGLAVLDHLAGKTPALDYDAVPDCFWADPELASVGLTEPAARERGIDFDTSMFHYRSEGIAHALGALDGFVKAIAEKGTGKVLGVHICGRGAPELIAEASVIVSRSLTVDDVESTIHAHPTLGEIVKEGILATQNRHIHG